MKNSCYLMEVNFKGWMRPWKNWLGWSQRSIRTLKPKELRLSSQWFIRIRESPDSWWKRSEVQRSELKAQMTTQRLSWRSSWSAISWTFPFRSHAILPEKVEETAALIPDAPAHIPNTDRLLFYRCLIIKQFFC